MSIVVVGLGPAGPELVTEGTRRAIERTPPERRFVRTTRHPSVDLVAGATSFDRVYEEASTLDTVYRRIVAELLDAARRADGDILYAVPGSPVVAEHTVELLLAAAPELVELVPALSFLELAWLRLGVDPLAAGARIVDGQRFEIEAAGSRGPLLVAQCDTPLVLSDVKLAIGEAVDAGVTTSSSASGPVLVTVLQRLGLPDESVHVVPWDELDRSVTPDHLTSLWIPALAAPIAGEVQRFVELVATLRRECPWDREQTHESLKRHLLEESYEVLDAIDGLAPNGETTGTGDGYDHLEEELGDLLFQVAFHATLAAEEGRFTMADVARTVHDKLYARHPHVFPPATDDLVIDLARGDLDSDDVEAAPAVTSADVAANWEQLKKAEKGRASVFEGIPDALPALLFALKVQKKASSLGGLGVDLPAPARWDPVMVAAKRSPNTGTIGDLLFVVVNLARHAGVDPEDALRVAARRYRDEIRHLER